MKNVEARKFDIAAARAAVAAAQADFATLTVRKERDQILPMFRASPDLVMAAARLFGFDATMYAFEMKLLDDFTADFVVSDVLGNESTTLLALLNFKWVAGRAG